MAWTVNGYCEIVDGATVEVAENESIAMLHDAATRSDVIRILAWLRGLEAGHGDPMDEPQIMAGHQYVKYRCQGAAVVIFWVTPAQRSVDVLRFAASASGFPLVSDLSQAEARLQLSRG